jgi:ubiquinone/menaquinone biosynthesis C-methylase UbiE
MPQRPDNTFIEKLKSEAEKVWPSNFEEIEERFNICCTAISVDTIKQLDIFQKKNDFETLETLKKKLNVFKDAEYVLKQILDILCEEKILAEKDGGYICLDDDPDVETPAESLVKAVREFPEEGAPFQWLARASDGIVRFIQGKLYGEEVMFPWNSFKLVEEVYNTSNVYGFYSRLAGKVIKQIADNLFSDKINILEIGAGTGNGTVNVLNATNDKFNKYVFTDVSKALVQRAEKKIKKMGFSFLEYRDLDISKDPLEQGIVKDEIDIALAVNVLHATDNINTALKNSLQLLKPGGWLILSEIGPPEQGLYRYMELTFGLLPSYHVYNDKEIRPEAPIIRPSVWAEEFRKAGFSEVITIPGEHYNGIDRGGIVIGIK